MSYSVSMNIFKQVLIIGTIASFCLQAQAASLDFNAFYFSDSLTESATRSNARTFFDLAFTIDLDKKGHYVLGWSYGSLSATDSVTTNITYSATEMGPQFGWFFTKDKSWSTFLTYNLQATAKFNDGTAYEWRGSSYKIAVGYRPMVFDGFYAGIFLNYYAASFSEQLVGTTTFSTISYSRGTIYPTLSFSYNFGD